MTLTCEKPQASAKTCNKSNNFPSSNKKKRRLGKLKGGVGKLMKVFATVQMRFTFFWEKTPCH